MKVTESHQGLLASVNSNLNQGIFKWRFISYFQLKNELILSTWPNYINRWLVRFSQKYTNSSGVYIKQTRFNVKKMRVVYADDFSTFADMILLYNRKHAVAFSLQPGRPLEGGGGVDHCPSVTYDNYFAHDTIIMWIMHLIISVWIYTAWSCHQFIFHLRMTRSHAKVCSIWRGISCIII